MKYFLWLLLSALTFAQGDIESVVSRNPFDPDRGKQETEEKEPEPDVIDDVPSVELPILDGTFIIGNKRIAVFSYEEDGRRITARVEMNTTDRGSYELFMREKKKPAPSAKKPPRRPFPSRRPNAKDKKRPRRNLSGLPMEVKEDEEEEEDPFPLDPIPNGKVAGYSVLSIERTHVQLKGNEAPFKLEMYREGVEKSRGGTKKAAPKPKPTIAAPPPPKSDKKPASPPQKLNTPDKKEDKSKVGAQKSEPRNSRFKKRTPAKRKDDPKSTKRF